MKDYGLYVPLRLYGDGADGRYGNVHFELYSILPVLAVSSSTLDSRLLTCVRNTATVPETRTTICRILAWSFNALRHCDCESTYVHVASQIFPPLKFRLLMFLVSRLQLGRPRFTQLESSLRSMPGASRWVTRGQVNLWQARFGVCCLVQCVD